MKCGLRRKLFFGFMILVVICILVWILTLIKVNNKDNVKNERIVGIGDTLEFDDISYTITEAKIYDIEAFVAEHSEYPWLNSERVYLVPLLESEEDLKILCYKLRVKTGENVQDKLPIIPDMHRTISGLWGNAYELSLISCMNEEESLTVGINSCTEIMVPVALYKSSFSDSDWNKLIENDPGLELVIAYQPELSAIRFNEVEYIEASADDREVFDSIMGKIAVLEENSDTEIELEQNNVFQNGEGQMKDLYFEIHEVNKADVSELDGYSTFVDVQSFMNDGVEVRLYTTTLTVTNKSENIAEFNANTTNICVVPDNDILAECELVGMKDVPNEGTKSAGTFNLEPGESVHIQVVYACMWSGAYPELTEETDNILTYEDAFYFQYNPNGQSIQSITDKRAIFIYIE